MTNANLITLVNAEIKNMRADIVTKIRKTNTGICISFKADMGHNRYGIKEYAIITYYIFHRIQNEQQIIETLRADNRLYA